jgi:hypothetical protein
MAAYNDGFGSGYDDRKPIDPMPCPWESHKLDTLPHGVTSWDDPTMDPMSCGTAMVMLVIEHKQQERRAA